MKKFLCIITYLVVISSVRSSIIYRKFRELDIPREENLKEKTNSIPVIVEVIDPAALVKDEIILPIETEKKLVDNVVKELVEVIAANEIVPKEVKDDQSISVKTKYEEKENIASNTQVEKEDIKIEEKKKEQEKFEEKLSQEDPKNDEIFENSDKKGEELRQGQQASTSRPTIFQAAQQAAQQIISNNPLGQIIDTFRRPLTSTLSPSSDQTIIVTAPNLLQQFQAGVQNFTSQFTSVFNPQGQAVVAQDTVSGSTGRPPNIIETIQTNFQNAVSSVFRPLSTNTTATGPLQVVLNPLQAVQSFFTGNRGESTPNPSSPATSTTQQIQSSTVIILSSTASPLDDKVDYNSKNSQEITDVQEEHEPTETDSGEEHEESVEHAENEEIKDHVLEADDSAETDHAVQNVESQTPNEVHATYEPHEIYDPHDAHRPHINPHPSQQSLGLHNNYNYDIQDDHQQLELEHQNQIQHQLSHQLSQHQLPQHQNVDQTNWNFRSNTQNRPK